MCLRPSLDFLFFRFEEEDFVGIKGKKYQAIFIFGIGLIPGDISSQDYSKSQVCEVSLMHDYMDGGNTKGLYGTSLALCIVNKKGPTLWGLIS